MRCVIDFEEEDLWGETDLQTPEQSGHSRKQQVVERKNSFSSEAPKCNVHARR